MSINLDGATGTTAEAMSGGGDDQRLEILPADGSVRPYAGSFGALSRQLALRFAGGPQQATDAAAAGDSREVRGLWRTRYTSFEEPDWRGPVLLGSSFCLGALLAVAACSAYLSYRGAEPPSSPSRLIGATASPPVLVSSAMAALPVPSPPTEEVAALPAVVVEPAPATPAEPASSAGVIAAPQEGASADGERALEAGDIPELQALLTSLGMSPGPVDGILGPLTAAAIGRYEESRGQPISGSANRQLLKRLRQDAGAPPAEVADRHALPGTESLKAD